MRVLGWQSSEEDEDMRVVGRVFYVKLWRVRT